MSLRKLLAFIRLTRPLFLLGGVLLYLLGVETAASRGYVVNAATALLGQCMVTAIQLSAQYSNEYYDVACDRLTGSRRTPFTGGSGILPAGILAPRTALIAARVAAFAAMLLIVVLATYRPAVGVIGAIALAGSWYYSSPPLSLMKTGWGELTTSIIVAVLVPLTGYTLQTGRIDPVLLVLCLPPALTHFAMMIAGEFPDYEADRAVSKRTLAVRLGLPRAAVVHNVVLVCAVVVSVAEALHIRQAAFLWIAFPPALVQIASLSRKSLADSGNFTRLTFGLNNWTA